MSIHRDSGTVTPASPVESRIARPRAVALVTGASSGIGHAYAYALGQRGYDVIAVARRAERLSLLAQAVTTEVEPLVADLTVEGERARVVARIERGDVSFIANVAGFGNYGRFDQRSAQDVADVIALHVRAVAEITRAGIRAATSALTIVNVGSLLALSGGIPPSPLPARATYAAAKAFMLTFTETLAAERIPGVTLQVVLPGKVATEYAGGYAPELSMSAEDVVRASLAGLARGEIVCVPGLDDPARLEQLESARFTILRSANRRALAQRYLTDPHSAAASAANSSSLHPS